MARSSGKSGSDQSEAETDGIEWWEQHRRSGDKQARRVALQEDRSELTVLSHYDPHHPRSHFFFVPWAAYFSQFSVVCHSYQSKTACRPRPSQKPLEAVLKLGQLTIPNRLRVGAQRKQFLSQQRIWESSCILQGGKGERIVSGTGVSFVKCLSSVKPAVWNIHNRLCATYTRLSDFESALREASSMIEENPQHPKVVFLRSWDWINGL